MSVRQDVERFFIHRKNEVDSSLSFKIVNDSTITFNFAFPVDDPLFVTGLPILPEHIFKKIPLDKLLENEINFNPVGIGPFKLENYYRQQQIVLVRNDSTNFDKIPLIEKVVFKVIPDYNSRLNQLKNGEIDLMTDIRPEDAEVLKKNFQHIVIDKIKGREYDYIGWNNINQKVFEKSKGRKIEPHPLFGNREIRLALTMAINREEILEGYFGEFATPAVSPISPIFKEYFNDKLKPIPYNPDEAKRILEKNGWRDSDNDGIIDKNGIPFKFKLTIATGRPHREFAAIIIKRDLKKIGIDVEIENLETSLFFSNLFERKLDAWIAGWTVPLDLDLEGFWGSDLDKNFFNVCGYQNREVDKIFRDFKKAQTVEDKKNLIFRFQEIIQNDQPVTFLYWIDNIVGYNKKIKNVKFNPIAFTNRIWEWYISQ
jgi:peptide/nickel transport system substrate-binding protein